MNNLKKHKLNFSLMIVGAIAVIILVNVFVTMLTNKLPIKLDMTANGVYSISDQTIEFLKTYDNPTDIYILASETEQDENVRAVLDKYAEKNSNIKITNINVDSNPTFGRDYVENGESLTANSVIVDGGERFKMYELIDLYGINEQSGSVNSLNVESKITSALKYVSSDETLKAYFVKGHNETDLTSGAVQKLTDENYEVSDINLVTEDIPDDASLIIIAAPTTDFSTAETAKLESYLSKGGNAHFYFDIKSIGLTNLYDYLRSWGIEVHDDAVVETNISENAVALSGSNMYLIIPEIKSNELTDSIIENKRTLAYFPYSKSIKVLFESSGDVSVVPLLSSTSDAYTTTNFDDKTKTDEDETGEFTVAALAVNSKYGSVIYVSGNTMLMSIPPKQVSNGFGFANYDYFMNINNLMTGSTESFDVGGKTLVGNVITIKPIQQLVIGFIFAILIPAAALIIGIVIWFKRRRL
ncbi:MAG: GldG family protein [Oscillospiraceae bacterium]|nr:GldG family protein [Oscillospiraceae bacterium]